MKRFILLGIAVASTPALAGGYYRQVMETTPVLPLPAGQACGLSGEIPHRIADCAVRFRSLAVRCVRKDPNDGKLKSVPCDRSPEAERWSLVSLTESGRETWRDEATQLVWSDQISIEKTDQDGAEKACLDPAVDEASRGFSREQFRLPEDFEYAGTLSRGAEVALPRMSPDQDPLWTNTRSIFSENWGYAAGEALPRNRFVNKLGVRCVLGALRPPLPNPRGPVPVR